MIAILFIFFCLKFLATQLLKGFIVYQVLGPSILSAFICPSINYIFKRWSKTGLYYVLKLQLSSRMIVKIFFSISFANIRVHFINSLKC